MAPRRNPEGTAPAAEHPNRTLARRFWEAMAAGDSDLIVSLLSPDIVWRSHGDHPIAGEYRGPEKVLDYLARVGETVDELRSEPSDIFTSEFGAVIHYRVSARRGFKRIDYEVLMILIIEAKRIIEATVVPADQRKSNEFWRLE